MSRTRIEWADETWPVVTGCTPVSEGCRNCYAARVAATRLKHHPRYKGLTVTLAPGMPRWTGEVRLNRDVLEQPLRWRQPRMVFVASMGDLFHESVSFEFIGDIWDVIASATQHTFQVLTKRPKQMHKFFREYWEPATDWELPLANVWLGVSVENQAAADERMPWLLRTPAAVHYVSVEPMLESIELKPWLRECGGGSFPIGLPLHQPHLPANWHQPALSWVICGGESGPGARVMPTGAASSIIQQCKAAGVPVFMKQLGSVWAKRLGLKSAKGSDMLEWPWDDLKVREYPTKDIIR